MPAAEIGHSYSICWHTVLDCIPVSHPVCRPQDQHAVTKQGRAGESEVAEEFWHCSETLCVWVMTQAFQRFGLHAETC